MEETIQAFLAVVIEGLRAKEKAILDHVVKTVNPRRLNDRKPCMSMHD